MSLSLAVSLFSCVVAFVLFVSTSRLLWDLRAGLRRELIYLDAMHEIDEALADQNYETAVGALLEWDHRFKREVAMQDARPWSPVRFWKLPPGYRADWS